MSQRFVSRFCVGDPDGPRSSVWRVWKHTSASKSDIFISPRNTAGLIKASLHESGIWRFAFTAEYAEREFGKEHEVHDTRLIDRWERPNDIAPGVTLAFRIVIPGSDLHVSPMPSSDRKQLSWIDPPIENQLVEIDLIITEPNVRTTDWPAKNGMGTSLLSSSILPSGETLWLVYLYADIEEGWILDRERFRAQLRRVKPRFVHASSLLKAGNPRFMVMGFYQDGSRYFMDLAAKQLIGVDFYLRAIFWSSIQKLSELFRRSIHESVGA